MRIVIELVSSFSMASILPGLGLLKYYMGRKSRPKSKVLEAAGWIPLLAFLSGLGLFFIGDMSHVDCGNTCGASNMETFGYPLILFLIWSIVGVICALDVRRIKETQAIMGLSSTPDIKGENSTPET